MKKVLVIVGPTAIGKTGLSIELAKKYNGEIISGDSVQVYKQLNIGSAKVTEDEMQGIPHHLIDELSIEEEYSVYHFQQLARQKIDEITAKGKLPIIVGGTGLYIKACLYDYTFTDEGNQEELLKQYEEMTNEELVLKLENLDPKALENIHPNNKKRLIRALIIAKTQGETKTEMIEKQAHKLLYDAFIIGLTTERDELYKRINQRVVQMINDGLENEVDLLQIKHPNLFKMRSMHGIGYKEWKEYFLGNQTLNETITFIQQHSRNFAKRQYTWFNNQMDVKWYDINEMNQEELFQEIEEWQHES